MTLFDEPSRKPLPTEPELQDHGAAVIKGALGSIPIFGGALAEELGLLLAPPLSRRRDDWFTDLARRLHDLEGRAEGFHFEDLTNNQQFLSTTIQATQAALRTHQEEKLEALRNAVLNVAIGNAPSDDLQTIFLNMVDDMTPLHLQVLQFFFKPNPALRDSFRRQGPITEQVVVDLDNRGLLKDGRPYAARNRDASELLIAPWEVSPLGIQFLDFIKAPR